jgi:NAD+ diphosphatase
MQTKSIYESYESGVVPPSDSDGGAWWFVFSRDSLLVFLKDDSFEIPFIKSPEHLELKIIRKQYLGLLEGKNCFCAEVEQPELAPKDFAFKDLRYLFDFLDIEVYFLAGKAKQIIDWDRTHQFCGQCGAKTNQMEAERAKICPECGFISYPRICPAVIVGVIRDGKLLMAHSTHYKGTFYSIIAGFLEAGETLEDCVQRELMEEGGIKVRNIRYFGNQPWPLPNSLMIGFLADYDSGEINVDGEEIDDAGWYASGEIPLTPSKISIASKIIDWFKENY